MRKLSKNILVLALSIAVLFVLSGCSDNDDKEGVKIWNKTGYDISMNNNKIKQGKSIKIESSNNGDEKYNIKISYSGGAEVSLGSVILSDIKENIEIKYEDGVTFIQYVTKKGDKISTKESELQKKLNAEPKSPDVKPQETQNNEVKNNIEQGTPSSNNTNSEEGSDNNSKPTSSNDNCVDVDDPNNYY